MSVAWQSDPKLVGQQIKKIRKQKHMTQDALAEELGGGCTNKTISRYETGKVEMGIQTLFDVAEALEVPVDKLVPDRLQVHMEELPNLPDRAECYIVHLMNELLHEHIQHKSE